MKEKLAFFGLSLDKDIACIVTDGASVMCALGRTIPSYQQLCLAHGIQCAVLDVLYKSESTETCTITDKVDEPESTDEDENEIDDSNASCGFTLSTQNGFSNQNIPKIVYQDLITKIRKAVKYFKISPTRTDRLNSYLSSPEFKGLSLVLDCKTRWSSLVFKTERSCLKKTLIDLKESTSFTKVEMRLLGDLSVSLKIIKTTVEQLCEQKSNLISAVKALKFMMEELNWQNDTVSKQLFKELCQRIGQRRNIDLVSTLSNLHNSTKFYETTESYESSVFSWASNIVLLETILNINSVLLKRN